MSEWQKADAYLSAAGIPYGAPTVGQTIGGVHASGSLHPLGRARDYGNSNSPCAQICAAFIKLAQGQNAQVCELFYAPMNVFYKNGSTFSPSADLRAEHQDHVHVGLVVNAVLPNVVGSFTATPVSDSTTTNSSTTDSSTSGIGNFFSNFTDPAKAHPLISRILKVIFGLGAIGWGLLAATK